MLLQIVSKSGNKGVNVHNRKCGVHNATTIDSIHRSDICLSQYDDPIGTIKILYGGIYDILVFE